MWLPPLVLGLALALLVLWPSWLSFGARAPGHETVDVWTHAWGLGWVYERLAAGLLPTASTTLGFPRGGTITPADPLGALLVLPVTALAGPGLAYLAEAFFQVGLAGAAGFLYGRALAGPSGGVLVGVACATSPTFTAELHNGILEANWIGLVPLAALAALRASPWTGLWIGLAALGSPYHGVSAAVLATLHLVANGNARALPRAAALALLGALPAFLSLRAGFSGLEPLEIKPPGLQEPTLRINAVDPRAFFRPGDFWTVHLTTPDVPNFRRTPYLGAVLLLAAAVGLLRARPAEGAPTAWARTPRRALLVVPVVLGVVFAAGPWIWWGQDWLRTASNGRYALPMLGVLKLTDGGIDHPLRFLGMGIVALAALAALGAGRLGPAVAALVLVENLAVAPNVWPLPTSDMRLPEVYAALPADGRAVIDLPAERGESMATGRYVYWSALHGRAVPYTLKPSARVPSMNPTLRTWLAVGTNRPVPPGTPGWIDPAADRRAALAELVTEGFGWVVLHPELCATPGARSAYEAAIVPLLGPPRELAGAVVWELPLPAPATATAP